MGPTKSPLIKGRIEVIKEESLNCLPIVKKGLITLTCKTFSN